MSDSKKTRFYMGVSVFGVLIMLTTLFLNPLVFSLLGFLSDAPNYRPANAWILFIVVLGLGTGCLGVGYRRFMGRRPEPTDRKKKLLIWLGIPLIAVLIVELTLRVRPVPTTTQVLDRSVPYVPSPVARHMLPNTEIDIPDEDGRVNYRIRSGYHGRTFQKTKPAGQVRLVFLGGSFVFGDHGPNREHPSRNWIGNIEGKLHETGHQHVRIINAGVPGHSSFDSLGRYLAEIHLFEPDYVFVCHAWNDMKYFRDYNRYSPLRLTATLQSPSHQYPKGLDWLLERTQL